VPADQSELALEVLFVVQVPRKVEVQIQVVMEQVQEQFARDLVQKYWVD
jgi:hypothetical protein